MRRRDFLHAAATLAAAPFVPLIGCNTTPTSSTDGAITRVDMAATGWATGGTAWLTGNYPDPFARGLTAPCVLYKASSIGPCHVTSIDRKDISEGQGGLPVRFAFLVADTNCQPVAGATVELWHCAISGLYSGNDASNMCTSGDAGARAARWFRGIQTADANGRVDFNTCYPGWYASRSTHIHFTVRVGQTEYVTSQLFFDDALNDEIYTTQPLYKVRGKKDTTNAADKVITESALTDVYFKTARMSDGAMLASKALIVHT